MARSYVDDADAGRAPAPTIRLRTPLGTASDDAERTATSRQDVAVATGPVAVAETVSSITS